MLRLLSAAFVAAILCAGCEPTNQGYAPEQPIVYSHAVHAGELQIQCEYWTPGQSLSPAFFRASVDQETFLARLQKLLEESGLTHRIASELHEAEQRVRAYEERKRRIEEERKAGTESTDGS